jgi:long-chain acyl-CoA synthetase
MNMALSRDPITGVEVDPAILQVIERETLPRFYWQKVLERGDKIAMRYKHLGIWRSKTWTEYGENVKHTGLGLASLGVKRGDVVAIMAEGMPEWLYADLGTQAIGGVTNGVYTTDSAKQVQYIVSDSNTVVFIAENEEHLDKILEVRDRCPSLKKIVVIDKEGLSDFSDPMVIGFEELIQLGREFEKQNADFWERQLAGGKPSDLAILIYTSGTTGAPKGAMISHRNILFQMLNVGNAFDLREGDEQLSFLPLCHIAERSFTAYWQIVAGTVVNFAESPETIVENMQEVQPTVFFAVPRLWEKFYSSLILRLRDAGPLSQIAYKTALGIGNRIVEQKMEGKAPSALLKAAFWVADTFVLRNLKRMVGLHRARWIVTSAAPISPDLIKWYHSVGLDLREVYGQTESVGIVTCPRAGELRLGTIGIAMPNMQVKLSKENEILLRGPHVFMGYLNNPSKTAETIIDGWLHTGDVGHIDEKGRIVITDR